MKSEAERFGIPVQMCDPFNQVIAIIFGNEVSQRIWINLPVRPDRRVGIMAQGAVRSPAIIFAWSPRGKRSDGDQFLKCIDCAIEVAMSAIR